jgi:polyvinyl alcohol dehydrogenase (cytochrome)
MRGVLILLASAALAQDGEALYRARCAGCHESPVSHAPGLNLLRRLYPETVVESLTTGSMRPLAAGLSAAERRALALFVTGKEFGKAYDLNSRAGYCEDAPGTLATDRRGEWNGWSPDGANTRFQPAPGFTAADVPKLELKWAFGIPNATIANGAISVALGRVFFGTPVNLVYALDAKRGCIHWSYRTSAPVRSAVTAGTTSKITAPALFFGDGLAYVYAVDAAKGALLWKTRVEVFPSSRITGTPKLHRDRLFVPVSILEEGLATDPKYECCRSRPSVVALDANTGKVLWRRYTIEQVPTKQGKNRIGTQLWGPSGASIWSSPTLDPEHNALYVATGNNHSRPTTETSDAVLALRMDTGEWLWKKQITPDDAYNVACVRPDTTNCPEDPGPDHDFGSSPILVSVGGGKRALLAGQKSGVMTALDPDAGGKILWQTRVGKGGLLGGIQWGSAADAEKVYVPLSDIAWVGERILNPELGGGMFALRIRDGEKLWVTPAPSCEGRKNCSPAQSAAASAMPGALFSASVDGHLRAYDTATGRIVWDFNTVRDYETVNQVAARGGSLDAPGPVIAQGMVYVPSGYGSWGGLPGNTVLAFGLPSR